MLLSVIILVNKCVTCLEKNLEVVYPIRIPASLRMRYFRELLWENLEILAC